MMGRIELASLACYMNAKADCYASRRVVNIVVDFFEFLVGLLMLQI